MGLHPNQIILSAVQDGACAELGDKNPYDPQDEKRYLGWEQGYSGVVREHEEQQAWDNASALQKLKCWFGFHRYKLTKIPGRPHINCKTGNIDRRDPIIKKYTCVCCNDVYFVGLGL